jgi:MFS family permease
MLSWGIVCGIMAFMQNDTQFYIYRFLLGAAEASLYPVLYAVVIPRWFTSEERPQAISVMLTSILVAPIVGAPLAGMLLDMTIWGLKGWQVLFLIEALPSVILGIALVYWMVDWPSQAKWLTPEEKQMMMDQYEKEITVKNAAKKYTFWQALGDKEVLKLCLIYFMWITGFWGFNVWMPTVLKTSFSGWSNAFIGWVVVIPLTLALIGFLVAGRSSSRTGEKRWHVAIPMFMGCIGMGLGPFVSDPFFSMVLVCITAIGAYAGMGVWWTYPTSFLSGAAAAGAVGLINSLGNIGGWVGPYLTGYIKDWTGSFQWAYIYLAFSFAMAGLLILTLRKKLPTSAAPSAESKTISQ